jgi:hypothetical protein
MNYNFTYNRFHTICLLFISFLLLQSCATRHTFSTSSVVPAAEGSVKVKKDNNNNFKIDLDVRHLADPKRLSPSREMYVVWLETERDGAKNIGQLNTSSGLLSNTLKSSLNTVSSFKPTGFFITAEDNATTQYPSDFIILRTGGR